MSRNFRCVKCGKEFSYDSPALENWALTKAKPDQIKCPECFGNKSTKATTKTTDTVQKKTFASANKLATTNNNSDNTEMSARLLKQKYDELCAVFGDDLADVKDYLGGWTTTLALSVTNSKKR